MADDFDELTSLGNVQPVAKVRGRPRRGARQQQQQQQLVLADAEPEVQDLVELAAIAAAPPRRHEQRSWQHAEQARIGKTAKRLAAKAADADAKRRRSEETLSIVVSTCHSVATSLGLTAKSAPMDDRRSLVISKLAVAPALRGAASTSAVSSQARAVGLLSLAVEKLQQSAMQRGVEPSTPVEEELLDSEINRTSRVARLAWQWDETSQRVIGVQRNKYRQERESTGKSSHQIMMQGGHLRSWDVYEDELVPVSSDPMLARALSLESQSCDHLCEGLVRGMPINPFDSSDLAEATKKCLFFVLFMCMDRASGNMLLLATICACLMNSSISKVVWLHAEPCAVLMLCR